MTNTITKLTALNTARLTTALAADFARKGNARAAALAAHDASEALLKHGLNRAAATNLSTLAIHAHDIADAQTGTERFETSTANLADMLTDARARI